MRTDIKKMEQYFIQKCTENAHTSLHKYASDNVLLRGHVVREFCILMEKRHLSQTALLVNFDFANKCAR